MNTDESVFRTVSRWHPAILAISLLFFLFVFVIGIALQIRAASGLKLIATGVVGLFFFGKGLLVKYEKEISESEERLKGLNS